MPCPSGSQSLPLSDMIIEMLYWGQPCFNHVHDITDLRLTWHDARSSNMSTDYTSSTTSHTTDDSWRCTIWVKQYNLNFCRTLLGKNIYTYHDLFCMFLYLTVLDSVFVLLCFTPEFPSRLSIQDYLILYALKIVFEHIFPNIFFAPCLNYQVSLSVCGTSECCCFGGETEMDREGHIFCILRRSTVYLYFHTFCLISRMFPPVHYQYCLCCYK